MHERIRLAVDIGGTFTDLVLALPDRAISAKVLTTHDAPADAVLEGIAQLLGRAGIAAGDVGLVIHGTTLATNALIERKGARTALVTTAGFRDSLEMAYEHRFEQYDLYMVRPEPLVSRDLRLEVAERMASDGSVLRPLDEASLERLMPILKDAGIESVAISFLHSYMNPAHEQAAAKMLAGALPTITISLSSEVCPEIREYERTSTTVANAYVQPLMDRYLADMQARLLALGMRCPLLLMMSSGGVTTVDTARRLPIRLVESGPAGGAILACQVAARGGYRRVVAFDMGGTTAKVTLIDDLTPQQSREFEIARAYRFVRGSGIPVRIPVIDMVEIGAGGGSIARVDQLRRVTVGPDSAGSTPGPACYGRGGKEATVTDADLTLGRIDPAGFAGGKIVLDGAAAAEAVTSSVAGPIAVGPTEAAFAIAETVDEEMASAARVHAVENGKETGDRTMIAFGGAAPLHAGRLAQKLGVRRVVIPVDAGVGSAHGFLAAPISYEVARTFLVKVGHAPLAPVDGLLAAMRSEAEAVVRLGVPSGEIEETCAAMMRYRGQGHEIAVPLPAGSLAEMGEQGLLKAFDEAYGRQFGRTIPGLEVEAVTWVLILRQKLPEIEPLAEVRDSFRAVPVGMRRMVDAVRGGGWVDAAVYSRADLQPGARLQGPAVIAEEGTSIIVPTGFVGHINLYHEVVLEETRP